MDKIGEARLEMFDDSNDFSPVEGTLSATIPTNVNTDQHEFNTLDEPISVTIKRDLKAVGLKFKHVLYPTEKKALLKEWDLWGPLLLCTFMATILQGEKSKLTGNDGGPEFAEVFVMVWIGAMIVTVNCKLLGGNISFFQSVCVLGYCLLPTAIALAACRIILLLKQTNLLFALRFFITMLGFAWATFASMVFLGDSPPPGRKGLAVYPIFLFYLIISWLILSHTVD